jgi:hypothetical protein
VSSIGGGANPPHLCTTAPTSRSNSGRRSCSFRSLFLCALLLQDEKFGVDGAAAGAVEPVGEAEGEEGAEEEGEDDGVVGWHFVHFCVREVGVRCWVF